MERRWRPSAIWKSQQLSRIELKQSKKSGCLLQGIYKTVKLDRNSSKALKLQPIRFFMPENDKNKRTLPTSPGKHSWANKILDEIKLLTPPIRQSLRRSLIAAFRDGDLVLGASSATLYMDRVPQSDRDAIVLDFVFNKLAGHLDAASDQMDRKDEPIRDRILQLIKADDDGKTAADSPRELPSSSSQDDLAPEVAVHRLLGIRADQISVQSGVPGEYFGYRRSTTEGDIIRFYIKIWSPSGTSLLNFENRYRRGDQRWIVRGFGFSVDGITYLVGHATSATQSDVGLGLRCFALKRQALGGWLVGPLLSVDRDTNPLAARVVLIPVSHHAFAKNYPSPLPLRTIARHIELAVTPKDLNADIRLQNGEEDAFDNVDCSSIIQAIILNNTYTTLRGLPPQVDRENAHVLEQIFALNREAVVLAKNLEQSPAALLRLGEAAMSNAKSSG